MSLNPWRRKKGYVLIDSYFLCLCLCAAYVQGCLFLFTVCCTYMSRYVCAFMCMYDFFPAPVCPIVHNLVLPLFRFVTPRQPSSSSLMMIVCVLPPLPCSNWISLLTGTKWDGCTRWLESMVVSLSMVRTPGPGWNRNMPLRTLVLGRSMKRPSGGRPPWIRKQQNFCKSTPKVKTDSVCVSV